MGFGADVKSRKQREIGKILQMVQPEDLLKFGLIPEFVGRLPVIATLGELNESALVKILTEPKNALVKQFQKLFEFENVALRFTDSALKAIAAKSLERKSGARGLRAIMETAMLNIMYEIPSMDSVKECVINEEVILSGEEPILLLEQPQEAASSQ
jgi:ATP-dependent Clp protease ATP-binding subunit ClpX